MTLPTETTLPRTPLPTPTMPSPTLRRISLSESLKTHGNDNIPPSSPPSSAQNAACHSPLSPADCRTLEKILSDVRSPSSPSSPTTSAVAEALLSAAATNDEGSEAGEEDEVQYEAEFYDYGGEAEDGYEDEDGSMELSDVEGVRDVQGEEYENDDDTIEDVMNLPGMTAPPAPVQDFSGLYAHDTPMSDERKEQEVFRAAIEKKLEEEHLEQEKKQAAVTEQDVYDKGAVDDTQDGQLDGSENPVFQALQDEIGMHEVEDNEGEQGELETFEAIGSGPSPSIPSRIPARRASEDNPMPSSSFITFLDNSPAVVQTPGGKHIEFVPNATIPDSPFTSTLNYFKQYKGKENSPSKRRRKASSPEEIAQIAREAREEDEEDLEDLDQYRKLDLAPMEPVMESDSAGDLITCGTPAKARDSQNFTVVGEDLHQLLFAFGGENLNLIPPMVSEQVERRNGEVEVDAEKQLEEHHEQIASPPTPLFPACEQGGSNDADSDGSDVLSHTEEQEHTQPTQHPAFINVIEMLPATVFWATVAPIAQYSNDAFDVIVEKLTRLKV